MGWTQGVKYCVTSTVNVARRQDPGSILDVIINTVCDAHHEKISSHLKHQIRRGPTQSKRIREMGTCHSIQHWDTTVMIRGTTRMNVTDDKEMWRNSKTFFNTRDRSHPNRESFPTPPINSSLKTEHVVNGFQGKVIQINESPHWPTHLEAWPGSGVPHRVSRENVSTIQQSQTEWKRKGVSRSSRVRDISAGHR